MFVLDIETFSVSSVLTFGAPPGWISRHEAEMADAGASIVIRQGELDRGGNDTSLVENIDDWKLHLGEMRWERLTERRWQQWEVVRKDRKRNHLWEIEQAAWSQSVGWKKEFQEQLEQLKHQLGVQPDLNLITKLFSPAIPHEALPKKKDLYNVHRIKVEGVIVRYVEDMHSVQMTVEGELPQETVEALTSDLTFKISALENAPVD